MMMWSKQNSSKMSCFTCKNTNPKKLQVKLNDQLSILKDTSWNTNAVFHKIFLCSRSRLLTLAMHLPFSTLTMQSQMLPIPNALCCSLYKCNCACAVTKFFTNFCQLLQVTRKRSWTSSANTHALLHFRNDQQRAFGISNISNWRSSYLLRWWELATIVNVIYLDKCYHYYWYLDGKFLLWS